MLTTEQIEYIQAEAKGAAGERWLAIFKDIVHGLYSSKGKSVDQVVQDQNTAAYIERELVTRMEVAAGQQQQRQDSDYI